MTWEETLSDLQKKYASSNLDRNSVLIAGPGTGKTYTIIRRVAYLSEVEKVPLEEILVISFTRAAAFELKSGLKTYFGAGIVIPRACTLHSFAFIQLLTNEKFLIESEIIPGPIHILNDWEEDKIIFEELKNILNVGKDEVKKFFHQLSSDFDNFTWDTPEVITTNANFISTWQNHRKIYGYLLRSELVYQVKKAIENLGDNFSLDTNYQFIIVDEFQDLNKCDLALLHELKNNGAQIFAIGDDDQSIYGFRFAFPNGIRNFLEDYQPSFRYNLEICHRCDKKILNLSQFVIAQDIERTRKRIFPRIDASDGEIHLYRFKKQDREAKGIALICRDLIEIKKFDPQDILILLRSDRYKKFSKPIQNQLDTLGIPSHSNVSDKIFEQEEVILLLSYLKLLISFDDSVALRCIFEVSQNNIGSVTYIRIFKKAKELNKNFFQTIELISNNPQIIPRLGIRIKTQFDEIKNWVNSHKDKFKEQDDDSGILNLFDNIKEIAEDFIENVDIRNRFLNIIQISLRSYDHGDLKNLFSSLYTLKEDQEQILDNKSVNILTMHKAKGLTKKAVIIAVLEDENFPSKLEEPGIYDELRLLYVSITRAKHYLALTYCTSRTGPQRFTGRLSGNKKRTLTRFLRNCPFLKPENGESLLS